MIQKAGIPRGDLLADTQVNRISGEEFSFSCDISEAWKGFHAHGGVSLAVGLRAVQCALGRKDLQPLYVSCLYSRPVPCGRVIVDVEPLAASLTVAHAAARLRPEGQSEPSLLIQATFGKHRPTHNELLEARFPDGILPPKEAIPSKGILKDHLAIVHQSETRWAHDFRTRPGKTPKDRRCGAEPAEVSSWIRYHKTPMRADQTLDPITFTAPLDHIVPALSRGLGIEPDAFYPITLAMDVHFFGTTKREWLLQHSRIVRYADGYVCGSMALWDEDQNLLAVSTQRRLLKSVPR